jgi:cytochrome c5
VEEQTDKVFVRNVSIVIGILVVVSITIGFLARDIGHKEDEGDNPSKAALTEQRIKSVAGAYTGEDGAAAIEQAATTAAPEQSVAFDGSLDAEMIYTSVCAVCHTTGAAGAPIPGTPTMADRAAKGQDMLLENAINGLNAMPARGGRADLSDEQMQAVVEFMLK